MDQKDPEDQEALEDQRRIIQLEHQADQKDLAVLEDQVAQADQVDQEDQVCERSVKLCKLSFDN